MRRVTWLLTALALAVFPSGAQAESPPTYLLQWGTSGSGNGQFDGPRGLAVGPSGNIFVTDYINNRIQKFSPTGVYLTQWGGPGSGNGQFNDPYGIAADGAGNVYVSDALNKRIQKFTATGTYVSQWGTAGTGNGQFEMPAGVAVDTAGNVYVADANNNRIQKFTKTGGYITQWGGFGTGNGQFNFPIGIAVDARGDVYVADAINNRIQRFTSNGGYLGQWGSAGSGNGQFTEPLGVGLDPAGHVYVTDYVGSRLEKFTSTGVYLTQWGTNGSGIGQFVDPNFVIESGGDVFVSDYANDRIEKFASSQEITGAKDVGHDQGGQLRIDFTANGLDVPASPAPITGYAIYRRIDSYAAPGITAGGAARGRIEGRSDSAVYPAGIELQGWDYVLTVPASGDNAYEVVVPTLADSGTGGTNWAVFLIRALTGAPTTYFESAPDSGYSIDNLPPAIPAPFTADYSGGATHLHWGGSTEPDFWYYRLYRGGAADFVPSSLNLIAALGVTEYVDPGAAGSYYKLSAVDVNGNESGYALVTPAGTTGVDGTSVPNAVFLSAPSPNPARDGALLRFGLPREASVSLRIYDVNGRLVRELADGVLAAGEHELTWDMRDSSGKSAGGGVFFVRMAADGVIRSRRFTVVP